MDTSAVKILDIRKLTPAMLEKACREHAEVATRVQKLADAIDHNRELSVADKRRLVRELLPADLKCMYDLYNADTGQIGKFLHTAAHQLLEQLRDLKGEDTCKMLVQAEVQMLLLGWALAEAVLVGMQDESVT